MNTSKNFRFSPQEKFSKAAKTFRNFIFPGKALAETIRRGKEENERIVAAERNTARQETAENERRVDELVAHAKRAVPDIFNIRDAETAISGKKVLIVEDDVFVLDSMKSLLRLYGATVEGAICTNTAMIHARETGFDIIIFDGHLAFGGTGVETARQMRQLYFISNPNAIMILYSADLRRIFEKEAVEASLFDDFAPKPDVTALLSRIAGASGKKIK